MLIKPPRVSAGFTLIHVLTSIGLLVTLLVTLAPLLNTTARMQRESGEKIQALWAIHGVLGKIRTGEISCPVETGQSQTHSLDRPMGALTDLTIQNTRKFHAGLSQITVSAEWTTLQGRQVTVSLTELMPGMEGRL